MALLNLHRPTESSPEPDLFVAHDDQRSRAHDISAGVHASGCSDLRTASVRGFRLSVGAGGDVAGFDLGPSPEEFLLVSLAASLSQAVGSVACARNIEIVKSDIALSSDADPIETDVVSRGIVAVRGHVTIATDADRSRFDGFELAVLQASSVAATLSLPIDLELELVAPAATDRSDDWQI